MSTVRFKSAILVLMFAALATSSNGQTVIFLEDFDNLPLGPPVDEDIPFEAAFTHTPPAQWRREISVPGAGDPDVGVFEWEGWSFADQEFWTEAGGGGGREHFKLGRGTVAVADTQQWNDLGDPANTLGFYNTLLSTSPIDVANLSSLPLKLQFDSSWRGECCDDGEGFDPNGNNQTAVLKLSVDGAPGVEILRWESAPFIDKAGNPSRNPNDTPNPFYKGEALNEQVLLDLREYIPADASFVHLEFGIENAGGDGWWAFDSASMYYLSTVLGDMNISGFIDPGDIDAFALAMRSTDEYRTQYFGEFPAARGSQDGLFDFDDIPWFVEILKSNGVATSTAQVMAAIQAVPEPAASTLFFIALGCLATLRRRASA